ncbi:MAG: Holliday junction resolvase RuvX [Pseudomonadaceae bacterium]|nr:Holliday junction resolvase RuvX [Pseudomonadaceae bacterium]
MPDSTKSVERVLAIDPGRRHYGFAVGNTVSGTASAVSSIDSPRHPPWTDIEELILDWRIDRVLVGLPINMDGSESDMSTAARAFADVLARKTGLPIEMVDERLSSREAGSGEGNHAEAAVVIAMTWLGGQP